MDSDLRDVEYLHIIVLCNMDLLKTEAVHYRANKI